MERVITLGLKYENYADQRELFALDRNGDISIVGEVCFETGDPDIFYCRKSMKEAMELEPDMIVFCGCTEIEAKGILEDAGYEEMEGRLIDVDGLAGPFHERIMRKQIEIIGELVGASDEQVSDRRWMSEKLFEYGFYPFFKLVKNPQEGVKWSTCGILQVPDEFVDFCIYISGLKCKNAIEIGVARGGSSYVMAALLQRNNPELVYNMVDIRDTLVNYEAMKKMIPALNRRIPCTSSDFTGEQYDFCFIDADHSYQAVMEDYRNVGQYARIMTVFHDVFGHEYDELDGGTVRSWREIKDLNRNKVIKEYSLYPDKWMGIGVITRETS